jgi:hypothetical protein
MCFEQALARSAQPFAFPLPANHVAKTCRLWLPLERLRRQIRQDLAPPENAPLMNFQIRRSIPLFGPSAPRPFPIRGRPAQKLHSDHGFGNSQRSQGMNHNMLWLVAPADSHFCQSYRLPCYLNRCNGGSQIVTAGSVAMEWDGSCNSLVINGLTV